MKDIGFESHISINSMVSEIPLWGEVRFLLKSPKHNPPITEDDIAIWKLCCPRTFLFLEHIDSEGNVIWEPDSTTLHWISQAFYITSHISEFPSLYGIGTWSVQCFTVTSQDPKDWELAKKALFHE